MKDGFIRVGAATIHTQVADCEHNTSQIIMLMDEAINKNIAILVYPELAITGYTCNDLFMQNHLQKQVIASLLTIREATIGKEIVLIVGAPLQVGNALYNCAIVISKGEFVGISVKSHIPNNGEFYEKRWFASGLNLHTDALLIGETTVPIGTNLLYHHEEINDLIFGIELCEDVWTPTPPSGPMAIAGASLIFNLSASNDLVGKSDYRKSLIANQSARTITGYVYASTGYGESTTDIVFGGQCLIYENGSLIQSNKRFNRDNELIYGDIDIERLMNDRRKMVTYNDSNLVHNENYQHCGFNVRMKPFTIERFVEPHPFVPSNMAMRDRRCEEIFAIQTHGLAKRLEHINGKKVVIGVSGGLDSTLALLVCAKTFDILGLKRQDIIGITMPGYGTTDRTYNNACELINHLECSLIEINIAAACDQHFNDIEHDKSIHNITYENTQARERTQILMDYANKENAIVVGTGDLSELALGWATYNGDHMSMYAVNTSVPKTLVRYLVDWVAHHEIKEDAKDVLIDILDTPVSPELLPPDDEGNIKQKTEEVVGPYELHDFFLYYMIRFGFSPTKIFNLAVMAFEENYDKATIKKWLHTFTKRFFSQQFKRSCLPDGPKVGSINLSPRGDWRMPSDAVAKTWLKEIDSIEV